MHALKTDLADVVRVPTSVLFRKNCPAANDHPTSQKRTCTAEVEDPMCPANTPMPLFPPNSEELTYLDQDREQSEEALQHLPDGSINYLPISMPATPVAPMSHADNKSLGLLEYEMSSEG